MTFLNPESHLPAPGLCCAWPGPWPGPWPASRGRACSRFSGPSSVRPQGRHPQNPLACRAGNLPISSVSETANTEHWSPREAPETGGHALPATPPSCCPRAWPSRVLGPGTKAVAWHHLAYATSRGTGPDGADGERSRSGPGCGKEAAGTGRAGCPVWGRAPEEQRFPFTGASSPPAESRGGAAWAWHVAIWSVGAAVPMNTAPVPLPRCTFARTVPGVWKIKPGPCPGPCVMPSLPGSL